MAETFRRGREIEQIYKQRYSARVANIRSELSEHNVNTSRLDARLSREIDYIEVMLIGEEIGALAEQLAT